MQVTGLIVRKFILHPGCCSAAVKFCVGLIRSRREELLALHTLVKHPAPSTRLRALLHVTAFLVQNPLCK